MIICGGKICKSKFILYLVWTIDFDFNLGYLDGLNQIEYKEDNTIIYEHASEN